MINAFRLPSVTATTEAGKLQQIQSYMYQLVEQLNVALSDINGSSTSKQIPNVNQPGMSTTAGAEVAAQATFSSIKSLIIKSADIVNAYYDVINKRLEGLYVAESDFGTYAEQTAQQIEANSTSITQFYTDLQQIISDIDLKISQIDVSAFIKSGILDYDDAGIPVYGLEVGQRTEIDGEEVFNRYARFTASKLSFFDSNGIEVAYISDKKLYISHVEITGSFTMGGFIDIVLDDKSVVTKWVEA
jgi:hypothetical protein